MEGAPPRPGQKVAPADAPLLQRNLRLLAALAEHQRQLRLEVRAGDAGPGQGEGLALLAGACFDPFQTTACLPAPLAGWRCGAGERGAEV